MPLGQAHGKSREARGRRAGSCDAPSYSCAGGIIRIRFHLHTLGTRGHPTAKASAGKRALFVGHLLAVFLDTPLASGRRAMNSKQVRMREGHSEAILVAFPLCTRWPRRPK